MVHLDANTECTALIVPLAEKGSRLANDWRPQMVVLPQWDERTLPNSRAAWEWNKNGEPFELWIFFFKRVLMLMTREFFNRLSNPPASRVIDRVLVKGKSVPLELIELRHSSSPENFGGIAKIYSDGFALYQEGKFKEAGERFRLLSETDKPSAVLAQRCAEFASDPPQAWDGVFVMTAK